LFLLALLVANMSSCSNLPEQAIRLVDLVINTRFLNIGPLSYAEQVHDDRRALKWTLKSEDGPFPQYFFHDLKHLNGAPLILGSELPVMVRCNLTISMKKRELDDDSISDDFHRDFSMYWESNASVRLDRHDFIRAKVSKLYAEDWKKIEEYLSFATLMPERMNFVAKYADDISKFIDNVYADEILHHRPIRECSFCGFMSEQRMKRCACRDGAYYCSRKCQARDWKRGHKNVCLTMKEG
jgi:hypothetical protein